MGGKRRLKGKKKVRTRRPAATPDQQGETQGKVGAFASMSAEPATDTAPAPEGGEGGKGSSARVPSHAEGGEGSSTGVPSDGSLEAFALRANHSWLEQLTMDPEAPSHAPNRTSRQVRSGHYVPVKPHGLPTPRLVAYSKNMARELGLSDKTCESKQFAAFFSGHDVLEGLKSWATPYALSIYGQEMTQNCPFGTGNGYGDGRAISIGEVLVNSHRWELQLKGAGQTPFCRGADGRAVLRSSVREFLVSEAMHALGVSTTRALSLVASKTAMVQRPWYSDKKVDFPALDDPRLSHIPMEYRKQVLRQLAQQARDPDMMQSETMAITCRVAPSFLRVGHCELFYRRACKGADREQLEQILRHAIFREYAAECGQGPLQKQLLCLLEAVSQRIATLTANWIRVGFCQGNFNSDNCLVAGRTMDYGPFGFMERFEALWNMWSGGGQHFGFLNQHVAGQKNYESFAKTVMFLLDDEGKAEGEKIVGKHFERATDAVNEVWAAKLGLPDYDETVHGLIQGLLPRLEEDQADYTIFFRQLAVICEQAASDAKKDTLAPLADAFYKPLDASAQAHWRGWINEWLAVVPDKTAAAESMRKASPKFVPREWMLVEAYTKAMKGDYSVVHELQEVFANPYDEQSAATAAKYYRKADALVYEGAGKGGTAFMS